MYIYDYLDVAENADVFFKQVVNVYGGSRTLH
jgi:hypothetical protein